MQRTIKLQDISCEEARANFRQAIFHRAEAKHHALSEQIVALNSVQLLKRKMLQKKLAAMDYVKTIFSLAAKLDLDKANLATESEIYAYLTEVMKQPAVTKSYYEASETLLILELAKDYLLLDLQRKIKRKFLEEHARLNKQMIAQSVIEAYERDAILLCNLAMEHEDAEIDAVRYIRRLVCYKMGIFFNNGETHLLSTCVEHLHFDRDEILQIIADLQYRLAMNPETRQYVEDFIERMFAQVLTLALQDSHFLKELINAADPEIAKLRLAGIIKLHMDEDQQISMIGRKAVLRLFTAKQSAVSIKMFQQRLRQQIVQRGIESYISNLRHLTSEQLSAAIVLAQMDVTALDRKIYFHLKNIFPLSTTGIETFQYCTGNMIRNFPDLLSCISTIESRVNLCMVLRQAIIKNNMIDYLQRIQDLNLGQYVALARLCMMNVNEVLTEREISEFGLIFRTSLPSQYTSLSLEPVLHLLKTDGIKKTAIKKMQQLIHEKLLSRCIDYHLVEDHINQLCTYLDYPNQPDTLRLLFCDGNVMLHPDDEIIPGRIIEILPDELLEAIDLSSSKEYIKDKLLYKPLVASRTTYLYENQALKDKRTDSFVILEQCIPKRTLTLC